MSDEGFHLPNLIRDEAGEEPSGSSTRGSFFKLPLLHPYRMKQVEERYAFFSCFASDEAQQIENYKE
jgi:hypothetical protein